MTSNERNLADGNEEKPELSLDNVELLDVDKLCENDTDDSWLCCIAQRSDDVDVAVWVRGGFASRSSSITCRSLLEKLQQVVKYSGWKKYSTPVSTPGNRHYLNAWQPESGIDTRTFTRPKKSSRHTSSAKRGSEGSLPISGSDVNQLARHVGERDDKAQEFSWADIGSRTFTKSSSRHRKSLLGAENVQLKATDNNSDVGESDERVRCNGGEAMVDCVADDAYWSSANANHDHINQLPNSIDIHILAKAKLQEKGDLQQPQSCPNLRKMSLPVMEGSPAGSDDGELNNSGRLSPSSTASQYTSRHQPMSRSSFSAVDPRPTEPSLPLKKSPAVKSCIPRPSSASKLPVQRKNHSPSARRNVITSYQSVDSSWREGCF